MELNIPALWKAGGVEAVKGAVAEPQGGIAQSK